jgi:ketosteroid isomerase-like protein
VTIRLILLITILVPLVSCAQQADVNIEAVNSILDDFHDAAANGDQTRYLNLMTENAVFMGTDESERWPKIPTFSAYVDARFENGRGWAYESVERHVQFSEDSNVAWFDEVVFSETNGRFRGTGTLVRERSEW